MNFIIIKTKEYAYLTHVAMRTLIDFQYKIEDVKLRSLTPLGETLMISS